MLPQMGNTHRFVNDWRKAMKRLSILVIMVLACVPALAHDSECLALMAQTDIALLKRIEDLEKRLEAAACIERDGDTVRLVPCVESIQYDGYELKSLFEVGPHGYNLGVFSFENGTKATLLQYDSKHGIDDFYDNHNKAKALTMKPIDDWWVGEDEDNE